MWQNVREKVLIKFVATRTSKNRHDTIRKSINVLSYVPSHSNTRNTGTFDENVQTKNMGTASSEKKKMK